MSFKKVLDIFILVSSRHVYNALILFNESLNHQRLTSTNHVAQFHKELTKQMTGDHQGGHKRKQTEEADVHGRGHFPKHVKKKGYCAYCKHIKRK